MLITDRPSADVDALRARLHGEVFGPDDAGYDEARRAWNLAVDQRPAAVAFPLTDADVVAVVELRPRGRACASPPQAHRPRRGRDRAARGHDPAQHQAHARRADRPGRPPARVRAGALWADVTGPASAYGLAPLAGSAPDVGVVGYTLGGGLSWLGAPATASRATASPRSSSSPPTAASSAPTPTTSPSCFWALRGGGGSFGVVTAMEFELYPVDDAARRRADAGRASAPRRSSPPGASGPRPSRTRSRSLCRILQVRLRTSRRCAVQARRGRGRDPRRPRHARPAARARARSSTCSPRCAPAEPDRDPQRPEGADPGHERPPRCSPTLPGRRDRRAGRAAARAAAADLGRAAPPRRRARPPTRRARLLHGSACSRSSDARRGDAMAIDAALTRLIDALDAVGRRPRAPELHREPTVAASSTPPRPLRAVKARVDGDDLFAANRASA